MKGIITALASVITCVAGIMYSQSVETDELSPDQLFEEVVDIIKRYETMHHPKDWPLVGYGHLVLPGEKYSRHKTLGEAEADSLLRSDLRKNCAYFRAYGADSLLLGTLAYNIGIGNVSRSSVVKKLKAGDRDIRDSYLQHCRYRGKQHAGIRRRRAEEFDLIYPNLKVESPIK